MRLTLYPKDLSFIVIGKNAEWSIGRVLDSTIKCAPAGATSEIIYVDSASTDRTVEIVSGYPVKIVRLPSGKRLCASAGRYVGWRHATGRYCVFIDSDMELFSGWLEAALGVLKSYPDIGTVSGIQVDIENAAPLAEMDHSADYDDDFTEVAYAGSAAVFRREALERAGSWNPYIVSDEEPELCLRIRRAGYRIVQLARPSIRHYGYAPPTISFLLSRRRRRLFVGYGQVIRYHLRTGLLSTYLRERGWMLAPMCLVLVAVAAVVLSWSSGSPLWAGAVLLAALLGFAADALRSRSLYRAAYHLVHRAFICEGTIRGVMMRPYAPNDYQVEAVVLPPGCPKDLFEMAAQEAFCATPSSSK